MKFNPDFWAIIIGGSSGFGLATAQKLAAHGMNFCIVHRDRRGAMSRIEPSFEKIRANGVKVVTFNLDALSTDGRTKVLDDLKDELGETGRVRMLLHAVAFGNLKLLAPYNDPCVQKSIRAKIAKETGTSAQQVDQIVSKAFDDGVDSLHTLIDSPE